MARIFSLIEAGLWVAMADFAFAGIMLLLVVYFSKRLLSYKRVPMPPGPLAWPIIGHIHLLDAKRPLHQTLYELAERYGHMILLQLGFCKVLVVASSELARECLTTHDLNFASRPRFSGTEHLGYDCTMFGLNPYDSRCKKLRGICTSQFLSPSKVESSQNIRREEVSKLVRGLFQTVINNGASVIVDVRSMMFDLLYDITIRLMLHEKSYMGKAEDVEELKEMIHTHFELLRAFNVGDYIPFLRWLDLQGCERAMKKYNKRRDEILQRVIDKYRLCVKKDSDESLIDVLLNFADKAQDFCSDDTTVKSTVMGMLLGAVDTTANTTEWAISSLLQHPEVLKRAQEELDVVVGRERSLEESDLPNLKYLEAIVKETLRLYPVAPLLLPHLSKEACTVGGYHVPANTQLYVNVWGIHRDPAEWERPLEFEPERFMNSSSPDVSGHDFKYMPFGYGRRACAGTFMGMRMLKFNVGKLLHSFDWSIPPGVEGVDMTEGRAVTLAKEVPLKAAIKPRLPHQLY